MSVYENSYLKGFPYINGMHEMPFYRYSIHAINVRDDSYKIKFILKNCNKRKTKSHQCFFSFYCIFFCFKDC